jgi:hypothetical protein
MLSKNAKQALDDMAANLKSQRGYIVEVQGFAPGRGQAAIQTSQAMADAVVRYLVLNHEVPVYRIFVMGMGNAPVQASTEGATRKNTRGGRVEVSLLKNNVDQLASANQPMSDMGSQSQPATGQSTGSSYSQPTQPQTQPNQVPR